LLGKGIAYGRLSRATLVVEPSVAKRLAAKPSKDPKCSKNTPGHYKKLCLIHPRYGKSRRWPVITTDHEERGQQTPETASDAVGPIITLQRSDDNDNDPQDVPMKGWEEFAEDAAC
jgi:hypothetical protein